METEGFAVEEECLTDLVKKIIDPSYTISSASKNSSKPSLVKSTNCLKVKQFRRSARVLENIDTNISEKKFPFYYDSIESDGNTFRVIQVSKQKTYKFPRPKHGKLCYTINEALIFLRPLFERKEKGLNLLITSMYCMKMIGYAKQAFQRVMRAHIESDGKYLVDETLQFSPHKGRLGTINTSEICDTLNKKAHLNAGMVTDGMKDAANAIQQKSISQVRVEGATMMDEVRPSLQTITNYDFFPSN